MLPHDPLIVVQLKQKTSMAKLIAYLRRLGHQTMAISIHTHVSFILVYKNLSN